MAKKKTSIGTLIAIKNKLNDTRHIYDENCGEDENWDALDELGMAIDEALQKVDNCIEEVD